jgi:hypothetical protein
LLRWSHALCSDQFKCDKCDFATKSEAGLKSHTSKKHKRGKDNANIVFPKQCTLCDVSLKNSKGKKIQMRTHSYKLDQFKCDHCDFVGGDEIDMEVHVTRTHEEHLECGLCDYEGNGLEALDIHPKTCETYQCGICKEKKQQLPDTRCTLKKNRRHAEILIILMVSDILSHQEKTRTFMTLNFIPTVPFFQKINSN